MAIPASGLVLATTAFTLVLLITVDPGPTVKEILRSGGADADLARRVNFQSGFVIRPYDEGFSIRRTQKIRSSIRVRVARYVPRHSTLLNDQCMKVRVPPQKSGLPHKSAHDVPT
jgi:hypothetical protein